MPCKTDLGNRVDNLVGAIDGRDDEQFFAALPGIVEAAHWLSLVKPSQRG